LFDWDGHIKLTDFGLSKKEFAKNSISHSFCGSPEYMCPEVLTGTGHNQTMDIYTLGALLYEMLVGLPPYYSKNRQEMYKRIVNDPVHIPKRLSKEAKDLLKRLLEKDPTKRIGAKNGISEIREHPFFRGINWSSILNKQIKPPYSFDISKSYFDPTFTSMPITWVEGDDSNCERERSQSAPIFPFVLEETDSEPLHNISKYITKLERAKTFKKKGKKKLSLKKLVDLPKGPLELFEGYVYSLDLQKPKSDLLKISSVKVCSVSGEDIEDEFLEFTEEPTKKREIIRSLTKRIHSSSFIAETSKEVCRVENKEHSPLVRQKTSRLKAKISQTRLSKVLAAVETKNLINAERSRKTESIIRMNDTINNVITERQRYLDNFLLSKLNEVPTENSSEEVKEVDDVIICEDLPVESSIKAKMNSLNVLSNSYKETISFLNRFPRKKEDHISKDINSITDVPVKKTIPAPLIKKSIKSLYSKDRNCLMLKSTTDLKTYTNFI